MGSRAQKWRGCAGIHRQAFLRAGNNGPGSGGDTTLSESEQARAGATPRPWIDWLAAGAFGMATYQITLRYSHSPNRTLGTLDWWLACFAVGLLIAQRFRGRRFTLPRDVTFLLLALAASIAVSTIASGDILDSLPRLAMYGVLSLLAVATYIEYRDSPRFPLQAYCWAIAVVHMPFVAEVLLWVHHSSLPFYPQGVRVPNFSHVRQFGEAGFLAAVSGCVLMAFSRRWIWLSWSLTCLALAGIMALGSRGALLSWIICAALLSWFSPQRPRVAALAFAAFLVSAATVAGLHVSGLMPSPNIFFRIQSIGADSGGPGFDSGRLQNWLDSLEVIAAHPLFGLGAEAYRVSGCCDRTIRQSHNFPLQLLMQIGVVGCTLLVALLWLAVRKLGGLRRTVVLMLGTDDNRALVAIIAAYLAYCLIDGLLYHPLPLIHFALFCGLLAAGLRQNMRFTSPAPQLPVHQKP